MKENDIYRALQRHLDKQPVGFPATGSGEDIRLLKMHFTPEEAMVALAMGYRYETSDAIGERLKSLFAPGEAGGIAESLSALLETMSMKFTIMQRIEEGVARYCLVPLVIGMYEGRVFDMDGEYIAAYDSYAHSMQHGLSFISTDVPQMRTIPIEAAIPAEHAVMRFDDVREHIKGTEGPIVIIECTCRKRKDIHGEPCRQTERRETCMVFGDMAKQMLRFGKGREIHKAEALDIMRLNQSEGLVLQTYNMQDPEVICSCCGCCCELLGIHRMLPNPAIFSSSSYHAVIDAEKCIGCRACEKKCQVDALEFDRKRKKVTVNYKRCIGCGNCVPACKAGALKLGKKKDADLPPPDFESLQERIMRGKPLWRLGRIIGRSIIK